MTRNEGKKESISQVLNIMVNNLHKEQLSQLTAEYRPSPKRLNIRSFSLNFKLEIIGWSPLF